MEVLLTGLEWFAVFVVGLLARFALLLVVVAILAIPPALVLMAIGGYGLARRSALGVSRVDGLDWRRDLYYSPGHTWVKRDRGLGLKVGLDDLARRLLPGARRVELPSVGTVLQEGDVATVIACGDKQVRIASPVEGTVTAVNRAVASNTSLIHRDPYARGWLFSVAPASDRSPALLRGEPARSWLKAESTRLSRFLETELGVAAADGGEFVSPAPPLLSQAQWEALTRAFLKAS